MAKPHPEPFRDPLRREHGAAESTAGVVPRTIESLYRSERGRLQRYFTRRVQGADAADMVQEVFRRLIRAGAGRRDAIARPEAYLSRVAVNVLRDRVAEPYHRMALAGLPDMDVADAVDPLAQLEARDALVRVEKTLALLTPRARTIFLLHRIDGLSYSEIGEQMGMSVKGVEKQMMKALRQLRGRLLAP